MAKVNEGPEAIEAIAQEEEVWSVIAFGNDKAPTLTEVGHDPCLADTGYYKRIVPGTNDLSDLGGLQEAPIEPMSRHTALRFRNSDAAWRRRPEIARLAFGLWEMGYLGDWEDGVVDGELHLPDKNHPNRKYYIRIDADGSVEVEITGTGFTDKSLPVEWHTYRLPRSVPVVEHTIALAKKPEHGPKEFTKTIYGPSDTVTGQVVQSFELVRKAVLKVAA